MWKLAVTIFIMTWSSLEASEFKELKDWIHNNNKGTIRIFEPTKYECFSKCFPNQNRVHNSIEEKWYFEPENPIVRFDLKINSNIWNVFNNKQQEFRNQQICDKVVFAYHKTKPCGKDGIDNFINILDHNFSLGKMRSSALVYGRGIYFTTKSIFKNNEVDNGTYIVALTLPGKVYKYDKPTVYSIDYVETGYNSQYGNYEKDGHDELVIREPSQILPIGLAHLTKEGSYRFKYDCTHSDFGDDEIWDKLSENSTNERFEDGLKFQEFLDNSFSKVFKFEKAYPNIFN